MKKQKPTQSAQYCRICHITHDADGVCGQHQLQFRKVLHRVQKQTGQLGRKKP